MQEPNSVEVLKKWLLWETLISQQLRTVKGCGPLDDKNVKFWLFAASVLKKMKGKRYQICKTAEKVHPPNEWPNVAQTAEFRPERSKCCILWMGDREIYDGTMQGDQQLCLDLPAASGHSHH